MATLGSKLVTKNMQWNANMTEQNHLGAALIAKPHKMIGVMDKLFSAQNIYSDNPLLSVLKGNSMTEEEIGGTEWEWDLKGADARPLIVLENVLAASETTPGKYKTTFKLKLDENWFLPGDILSPGASEMKYQVRIMDEVKKHGDGWIYMVRLMTDNEDEFLPVKYLKPGTQWAKLYSQYEEAATEAGSTTFSFPISLKNKMGKIRKKYSVTDYAAGEVLAVGIPDHNNKVHSSWINYAEVEYHRQWNKENERACWYSRSTDTVIGKNGRPVRSGPGIFEQLEDSHIARPNYLTAKILEEYLMDIYYSRTSPSNRKKIRVYTGEYGMLLFHKAMTNLVNNSGYTKNVENYINKVNSPYHNNAYRTGYQMVQWDLPNGISVEVVHMPLYDDRTINFEIDKITGYPANSLRMTFMDFSGEDGKSNIKYMKKRNGFAFGYVQGLVGPYGPLKGGLAAHSGSYYDMIYEKSFGVHIHDVTKCGEIILTRN